MTTTRDEQFVNKKYVKVYMTTPKSELRYTDLLSFCYRTFQSTYDEVPTHRRTAKATGLKEETVAKAAERLRGHGLLDSDNSVVSPCPRMDWFQELESLREQFPSDHWSKWLRNWRAYIRKPGDTPLQVSDILIYSLIRNSLLNGWKPQHGWSYEYLGLATGTSDETASRAISRLEKLGFLEMDEGKRFRLFKLQSSQLACFADKKEFSGSSSSEPDVFVEEFSPASEAMERRAAEKQMLIEWIKPLPISDKWKDRMYYTLIKDPNWPDWKPKADRLLSKALEDPDY